MKPRVALAPALAVGLILGSLCGETPSTGAHLLFDFEEGADGWSANVYGKGKMTADRAAEAKVGQGAMAVHFRELQGANLISPAVPFGQTWRQRRFDRVRFWAKSETPMAKAVIVFVTDEAKHNTYNLHFPMQEAGWQHHTYSLGRCWNRGKKGLDATRVTGVRVTGQGTFDFSIDHLELLEAAREVYLRPDRHIFVTPTQSPPSIDADLTDPTWQKAAHLEKFLRYPTGKEAVDQTEAWVTYDAEALYVAARLYTKVPDKLKAEETARDASVWRDDCLEVFVDPRQTHREWYQFVTNSIGSQYDGLFPGGVEGRGIPWNGVWEVKVAVGKDAWVVEMKLPFENFGVKPEPGDSWGFNVCREAPSTGELSFWTNTGGRFTRIRGLADLVFVKEIDESVKVTDARLEETEPGSYILRARTSSPRAAKATYRAWVQSPEDETTASQGALEIAVGEGELAFPVAFEAKEEGEAKVWFAVKDAGSQKLVTYGAYNFAVRFPSQADLSKLVLVPAPKELALGDGAFQAGSDTIIQIGNGPRGGQIASVIARELRESYGLKQCVRQHAPLPGSNAILVGRPDTSAPLKRALEKRGLLERLNALKPEGYVLVVEPERVLVAGKDDRGTYYATRTFLQLVANSTSEGQTPRARCSTIVDWPDFPFRGYMIYTSGWPQDPIDPVLLKEFIYREVAGLKYNAIVWQMKAGYQYARWPKLSNRCALSRETVQEMARFARDHFIDMMPSTNIHGHATWIVLKYPELKEDGKDHQICTRHPQAYPLLFDTLEEMLEVFDHPKRLHVGLDEVRWKTYNLPEDERCVRCRGVPKWQIFADHITRLHDFLEQRGVEMWMWGDMLVSRHNGGPPFDCRKALDVIPKDVVICNWSADYAMGSSKELAEKGFRVVRGNSREVPLRDQPYVLGNLASFWYRHPWCTVSHVRERGFMMATAFAADFTWNVNRESITLPRYARERDLNVLRLIARPAVPNGGADYTPVNLSPLVNRSVVDLVAGDGEGWADAGPELDLRSFPAAPIRIGPASFSPVRGDGDAKRAVWLTGGAEPGPVTVKKKAASLAFLHTAVFPHDPAARKKFLRRFMVPVDGVPVAACRVSYAGGKTAEVAIRIGMEVGSWLPTSEGEYLLRCPYIFRLATDQCRRNSPGAADAVIYVYEWRNPYPTYTIEKVEFSHTGIEAAYALLALSVRGIR